MKEPEELDAQTCASLAETYPFFEYSATNWARHFAQSQGLADDSLMNLALRLSDRASQHQCENWLRFFWITCMQQTTYPPEIDQLVIAGFFDHFTLLDIILTKKDSYGHKNLGIALYWASRNGNNMSVIRLIKAGAHPNLEYQSALSIAAAFGRYDVVKTLLDDGSSDINHGKIHGTVPI